MGNALRHLLRRLLPIADIQQFLIFILVPVLCGSSLIAEFPSIMQGFEARKKFPLKQSCQGLPGEKKTILFLMPVTPGVQSASSRYNVDAMAIFT